MLILLKYKRHLAEEQQRFPLAVCQPHKKPVAHFTKRFLTLCSLLNWFHRPLVLEGGEFFVSGSIFSRLCRMTIQHPKGGLQKVWVKLSCMFVEQFSSPWCIRVRKMHKGAEFLELYDRIKAYLIFKTAILVYLVC